MQIADKYYLNYLAKFIADNRYYRDNFEKIIDYRDKKYCTDNGNPSVQYKVYPNIMMKCTIRTSIHGIAQLTQNANSYSQYYSSKQICDNPIRIVTIQT